MMVIFRERPFPTITKGRNSAWFDLPMWAVSRQDVVGYNVGRSGDERYNAYFVAPQLVQEVLGQHGPDLSQP